MAKDNREIKRGVRHNGQVFKPGQEDELQSALSPEQIERFTANGTLEGDWGQSKASDVDEETGEVAESPRRSRRHS